MDSNPVDFVTLYNLAHTPEAVTVQHALLASGDYTGKIDGAFGPLSLKALAAYSDRNGLPARTVYVGSNGCNYTVYSDGNDLVAPTVFGTCFGSMADVASGQDNGICADGFRLKDNPTALAVSLPMSYARACKGSPWGKKIPFGTLVQVGLAGGSYSLQGTLHEVGPSSYTGNAVDLSEQICKELSGNPANFNANDFKQYVDVRVLDGFTLATR